MAFLKNKILYTLNDNNEYEPFYTVNDELFLTDDPNGVFSYDDFVEAVKNPIRYKITRVYLLNNDETIYKDISEYVLSGSSLSYTYAQGKTRSGTLVFSNKDYMFNPHPINGLLWDAKKVRIDIGIVYGNIIFWQKCGIYVMKNPEINDENGTISVQIHDKYALLDGTVGGKRGNIFKIVVGTSVKTAIEMCLKERNYNGRFYDEKPLIFPGRYSDSVTPYTINQTGGNIGDIPLELCKMISCDICYNEIGNLTVSPNSDEVDMNYAPIWWDFYGDELLYTAPSISYDYTNVPNKVIVTGAIENGKQYKGEFTNTNPKSKNNIYISEPNILTIEDSNIISDKLCNDRAKYEWQNASRRNIKLSFSCVFIPCLIPNRIFTWTNEKYGFNKEKFLIDGVSFDLVSNSMMSISASNLNEVS